MSADVFVFVAQDEAPAEADVRSVLASMDRVYLEVDVPSSDLTFEPGEVTYVEAIVGPFRVDAITYHGGTLHHVADLLDRCYSQATALADRQRWPLPDPGACSPHAIPWRVGVPPVGGSDQEGLRLPLPL